MPRPEQPGIEPNIEITSPAAGAVLTGSRDGVGDTVELQVTDFTATSVSVQVQQGTEQYTVRASGSNAGDGLWTAVVRFRHAGTARLVGVASRTVGRQTYSIDSVDPVAVTVAANQRQPIAVTLDNAQDADPVVPANGARIGIPVGGAVITISATIGSPTQRIEFQTSLDNYSTTQRLQPPGNQGSASLSIAGNQAPRGPVLLVRDVDFFGEARETSYNFWLVDNTPPTVEVTQPLEDQELYLPPGQQAMDVTVTGRVDDGGQSGYKPGTLTYAFNGQIHHVEPDNSGRFEFVLSGVGRGSSRVVLTAEDDAGNKTPEVAREFTIASKYKPKTIGELLSPRSYLADLLRFAGSHVLDQGNRNVSSAVLSQQFMPVAGAGASDFFGTVSEPGSAVGERVVNELLPAVVLLRTRPRGLLLRLGFDSEQGQETPDSGPMGLYAALTRPGLIGRSGTPTAGALELDGSAHARAGGRIAQLLSGLGKDNADFSVSFWVYLSAGAGGNWRAVMYKGHEVSGMTPANSNRTFGIWLHPGSNRLHYRIGTVNNPNEGGDSVQEVPLTRWTHVVYVKRGARLELFVNGVKDSSVGLSGAVVANGDELSIGKSPYHVGFQGAMDDVRIYDFALTAEDASELAQDRTRPAVYRSPLNSYVQSAYEALLVAHGTSYEELRALPAIGTEARRVIAQRLGLTAPNASDDGLDILLLPQLGDEQLEFWLTGTFDLPSTRELLPPTGDEQWRGGLLAARQDYLARRWQAEDAASSGAGPLLDPDLIDAGDLVPAHPEAPALLRARARQLEDQWTRLYNAANPAAALALVYTADELVLLEKLEGQERTGEAIADRLPVLGLTLPAFRRVRFYQQLSQAPSTRERQDLAHLLTQSWKLRDSYPLWRAEERRINPSLWPNSHHRGVFRGGSFRREFLPWRGNAAARIQFEKLVAARLGAFDALSDGHRQAVLDAQRVALPLFRDRLLAITELPSAADVMDQVTERLLVDVAAAGTLTRSVIDHATLMLQRLTNGIRLGRFEAGHPAAGWRLRTAWQDAPTNDANLAYFDEEWRWMGSYGAWRSAKSIYLYPENALFPDLRTGSSVPYAMTARFRDSFLGELRKLAPVPPTDAWVTTNAAGVVDYEASFFVPAAIGVMLERAGQYSLALDWYRRVYETRNPPAARAKVPLLAEERNQNKAPLIRYDDRWTLHTDPHTNARQADRVNGQDVRRFGNPYTRFILARITRCLVGLADAEFARGTDESRATALDLYVEAKQILGFEELTDLPPADASEGYLPNPVFSSLRDHVSAALRKLRRGLTHLGAPMLSDSARPADGVSLLSRPTAYRFRALVERSRQLVAIAQNLEAQYLSSLEKRDVEEEKFRREAAGAQIAEESVALRSLQQVEARDGVGYAQMQKGRSQILRDRYAERIAAGPNQHERSQIDAMWQANTAKTVAAAADAVIATAQAIPSFIDVVASGGAKAFGAAAIGAAAITKATAQGFATNYETSATVSGILAAQERRQEEWQLQRELAQQDMLVADQQIGLARDRAAIADQEFTIATIQRDLAQDMLKFLSTKFTSVELYEWMSGVLAEVYAFLLRTATTVARQAEGQLAFERQQTPAGLIKQDYWGYVSQSGSGSGEGSSGTNAPDRRGITASARLLQDVTALDQYAFDTERRLLNLSHAFSLARQFPIEFEEFRKTGVLSFATTLRMFDDGFPGHYMRLIKKVRVSVAALIPPNLGIRATLSTSGLSRVVTGDPSYPVLAVPQEPQSVALTNPMASTGVFELDMQSELLYPFEGMGVDTNWTLEMPPAGNPFDFDTLFDVLVSVDYTALNSIELRDRVVKQLPREALSDRAFSVRRDLPDIWYDLANNPVTPASIALTVSRRDFPSHLQEVSVREVAIIVRRKDGRTCDFKVRPAVRLSASRYHEGSEARSVNGIVSSRQSGAATWHSDLFAATGVVDQQDVTWSFDLADAGSQADSVVQLLRDGSIDDVLIVFTFSGTKPAWN